MSLKQVIMNVLTAGCLIGLLIAMPSVSYAQDPKVKNAMETLKSKAAKSGAPKVEGTLRPPIAVLPERPRSFSLRGRLLVGACEVGRCGVRALTRDQGVSARGRAPKRVEHLRSFGPDGCSSQA
jgi:hypothetical protein